MAPSGSAHGRTAISPLESIALTNSTSSHFLGIRQPVWMSNRHAHPISTAQQPSTSSTAIPPPTTSQRRVSGHNATSTAAQRTVSILEVSDLQSNRHLAASSVLPSPAPSDDGALEALEMSGSTSRVANVAGNAQKRPWDHDPLQQFHPTRRNPTLPQPQEIPLTANPAILPSVPLCMAAIDTFILQNGGNEVLAQTSTAVVARINLLREASFDNSRDTFYLALHQILCLALSNPDSVPHTVSSVRGYPVAIDFLRGLLGDTPAHVRFPEYFSRYPHPNIDVLRAGSPVYAAAIINATTCLELMAERYLALDTKCVQQETVPSLDELCLILGAHSPILQRLICNSIVKKTFWIANTEHYSDILLEMERAFKAYQADYSTRVRSTQIQPSSSTMGAELNAVYAPIFMDIYNRIRARRSQPFLPLGTQSARSQAVPVPTAHRQPLPSQNRSNLGGQSLRATNNPSQPPVWPYIVPSQWSPVVAVPPVRRDSEQSARTELMLRSHASSSPAVPQSTHHINQLSAPRSAGPPLAVPPIATPFFARAGIAGLQITPTAPSMYALHQAILRSPVLQITRSSESDTQPLYQFVAELALRPQELDVNCPVQTWSFTVGSDTFAAKARDTVSADGKPPLRLLTKHSFAFRLRVAEATKLTTLGQWVVTETAWPRNVFFTLNQTRLHPRRKMHNGRDLPVDITNFVVLGRNTVSAFSIANGANSLRKSAVAVEIVKVQQYQDIKDDCNARKIPADLTKETLMESLSSRGKIREDRGVADEDDLVIISKTLNISLLDPFLAGRIWDVPIRGADCRHRECFDLETWLQTRGKNDSAIPSPVDEWKCPICGADCRPASLMVDEWMQEVRNELERRGQLDARAITVTEDGSWKVKMEGRSNMERYGKGRAGQRGNSASLARPTEADVVDLDVF